MEAINMLLVMLRQRASGKMADVSVDAHGVRELVRAELVNVEDGQVRGMLQDLLASPSRQTRGWAYSEATHDVWVVARRESDGLCLLYCQTGFGPGYPWGIGMFDDDSLGSDDVWHVSLYDAFINSDLGAHFRPADYEVP